MKQSRKLSLLESILNGLIGVLISFLIQVILYPMLDIPVSVNQNILITIVFFLASLLRNYLIRRFFNHSTPVLNENYLQLYINMFETQITDKSWTVIEFLKYLKTNEFKIKK